MIAYVPPLIVMQMLSALMRGGRIHAVAMGDIQEMERFVKVRNRLI